MVKVELHAHTADDPVDYIPHTTRELIDRAAALGYGALAITLHERQLDVRGCERHARRRGITLIAGVERTVEHRHLLLLNFSPAAERVRTFAEVARLKSREPQGLIVAPHPFFPGRSCLHGDLERHAELFDAVERNAMFVRGVDFNTRAEAWAARRGKPMVGNGDVHRLAQLGPTWSLVDAAPDPDAICDAIRAGRVSVQSRAIPYATAARVLASMGLADLGWPFRHARGGGRDVSAAATSIAERIPSLRP
jgi:predicted metal-dependent phosphoesterase TrpH